MSDVAAGLRETEQTADAGVSVDRTWQRKGFLSTLAVVTAISVDNWKVLDVDITSKSRRLHKYKKLPLIPALPLEWGIIPALPLEWGR